MSLSLSREGLHRSSDVMAALLLEAFFFDMCPHRVPHNQPEKDNGSKRERGDGRETHVGSHVGWLSRRELEAEMLPVRPCVRPFVRPAMQFYQTTALIC